MKIVCRDNQRRQPDKTGELVVAYLGRSTNVQIASLRGHLEAEVIENSFERVKFRLTDRQGGSIYVKPPEQRVKDTHPYPETGVRRGDADGAYLPLIRLTLSDTETDKLTVSPNAKQESSPIV